MVSFINHTVENNKVYSENDLAPGENEFYFTAYDSCKTGVGDKFETIEVGKCYDGTQLPEGISVFKDLVPFPYRKKIFQCKISKHGRFYALVWNYRTYRTRTEYHIFPIGRCKVEITAIYDAQEVYDECSDYEELFEECPGFLRFYKPGKHTSDECIWNWIEKFVDFGSFRLLSKHLNNMDYDRLHRLLMVKKSEVFYLSSQILDKCNSETQLLAIKTVPCMITRFSAPSTQVKAHALKQMFRYSLKVLADKGLTYEDVLEALKEHPNNLKFITNEEWRERLPYDLIQHNGLFLQFIPPSKQTQEMCLMAVKSNPKALEFVRDKTSEVIHAAISKDKSVVEFL